MAKKKKKNPPQKRRASRGVQFQRFVFIMIAVIMIATLLASLLN